MKNNKRDKNWLRNPDQRKNTKLFNVKMIQLKDGSFHVVGGESKFLKRYNQHRQEWTNVDTRDLVSEIRSNGIRCF
jgi:hypothetical protein